MRQKWLKNRAANFYFTHFSLLASEVVIFQAGKAYSNVNLNNVKYNNKQSTAQSNMSMYVCMSANIFSD